MANPISREALQADISQIICDVLAIPLAVLENAPSLRQLKSVDSINLVRVIARIEDQYDIELEDELVFDVTTLDELVTAVDRLVARRNAT